MRLRYLWALVPAALAMGSFGIQMTITVYDDMQSGPYGTSYEVRWLVELGIYLAYIAGLACFDTWRNGRLWLAAGMTWSFAVTTFGLMTAPDSIGGGLLGILGSLLNLGFGLALVFLVVKRHNLTHHEHA